MQLPDAVKRRIQERAEQTGFPALKRAAAQMSEAYRAGSVARLPAGERTAAYLVTRMPATYAAAYSVLEQTRAALSNIGSILDVGAGTGAASLAARQWFPEAAITMLEKDAAFAAAAREFLPDARLISADAATMAEFPPHDLVIAAYSLGELARPAAQRLWKAARVALIVIEPGTPSSFALVRSVRTELLASGARMLAPCPGEMECPMVEPNWCHFAARVERSSLHRRVKEAQLNYEDEKFSYLAVGREAAELAGSRIVRHPQHQPGLIVLETCTRSGLTTVRVGKRNKDEFRAARQARWGDRW
ncbi:MAG TPA: small ribosomal subunit Rsm22 family protein [Candidatus Sulfopaludibacter sp.]|nr:small ribosomal subunit Rsm22 family protein [Candidatus Sulfopaludibacter sp.]